MARVTIAMVRKLALALPGTTERPSYGTPGFRVRDKLFARVLDDDSIVARVDLAWRDALVASAPRVFAVTPHYQRYPWVVVRLPAITAGRLRDVLHDAWQVAGGGATRGRSARS